MLQGQTPGSRSQIISAPPAPAHCCRLSSSITWKRRVEILRLLSLNLILLTSRTLSNMTHLMLSEIQPRFPPIFYIFSLSNMVRFYINLYIYIFSPYFSKLQDALDIQPVYLFIHRISGDILDLTAGYPAGYRYTIIEKAKNPAGNAPDIFS